ncbi:MAG: glycerate kinase [Verrucomicrobiales bacterium]|nr:glycerate kinase [Verrucomicrobiales bacterium]
MRILIAPDKFKGTLTAEAATNAIARGWRRKRRGDELECLPISDGGDGFGSLLGRRLEAEARQLDTTDAAGRPVTGTWWWVARDRLAILETANVIGLALLPPGRFHPFELDTFGLGGMLRAAAAARPKRCVVGIGGSATNDAGFGLARALGWRFEDARGDTIPRWPELTSLARVRPPVRPPRFQELVVAVDVRNRLLGARGASRIYGPQKGLRPEDMAPAERAFQRLVRGWKTTMGKATSPASEPGAGAAGGLGFGLAAFCGARIESGFEIFARHTELAERIAAADLVITGEGALDLTSVAMGKGVGRVAALCRRADVPCVGLAGIVAADARVRRAFTRILALTPDLTSTAEAMRDAGRWLARLAEGLASEWPANKRGQVRSKG